MKYLKKYNESKGSDIQNRYSIYDWFEDLKSMEWNRKSINKSELKKWSDHFIGKGVYERISNLVNDISKSIRSVDIGYISDRMLEVWDELPSEKDKYVMFAVAYGNYENFDKSMYRYNGLLSILSPSDDVRKLEITIHIIKEILMPSLFIGSPSIRVRRNDDQIYVTDDKWNCLNFNINNYGFNENDKFDNGESGRRSTTTIFKYELDKKEYFTIDKVIDMYKPCIVIEIGGYESQSTGKIKISHIEELLDDVLETILPELDYEEVLWDKSRGVRKFTDDECYDYTLKIILSK